MRSIFPSIYTNIGLLSVVFWSAAQFIVGLAASGFAYYCIGSIGIDYTPEIMRGVLFVMPTIIAVVLSAGALQTSNYATLLGIIFTWLIMVSYSFSV